MDFSEGGRLAPGGRVRGGEVKTFARGRQRGGTWRQIGNRSICSGIQQVPFTMMCLSETPVSRRSHKKIPERGDALGLPQSVAVDEMGVERRTLDTGKERHEPRMIFCKIIG